MQLFLDTANLDEIRQGAETKIISGVTTNPTLIMKEGRDYVQTLKEITKIVNGPISAETISLDAKGMVKEGKEFAKIHKNIVIKGNKHVAKIKNNNGVFSFMHYSGISKIESSNP